ncbi:MAG: hypothetical protein LBV50_05190 [Novosphingobium sp.]|jgi:hypothetical protein|nr:hypothetical protein [Novosphingobium sp.]
MRRFIALACALLAVAPAVSRAAEPPCLSPAEFTALADYALPGIISGASQRCRTTLAPGAFLRRGGPELIRRYALRKPAAWPGAKAAFLKLSATGDGDVGNLIRTMPDASLQQVVDGMIEGMVSQQMPLDRCGTVDRLIDLLSPLPPQSIAEAVALAVGLGARAGRTRIGKISICAA